MQQPLDILKKYWQHDAFRPFQQDIINTVLAGDDAFALLPTGGGKSVCFQVPTLIKPGICLVISPLIALMKDQVQNLQKKDIKAIALTGSLSVDQVSDLLDNCRFGNYKFLYLSPERLENDWIVERIKELDINLVAIDEAHCVSQWGHDFRPAYLKIGALRKHLPNVPFLALTASATKRVQADVTTQLGLIEPKVFKQSFARENIAYMVFECEDKLHRLTQIFTKNAGPAIIYVRNRRACHEVSAQLQSLGFSATFYHGGLKENEKQANMQAWLNNRFQIMVATNAFGMGIDKPDVKVVVHLQLPENIESYYQEAGRAGRNGQKSFAVMLVNPSDVLTAKSQFLSALPDKVFLKEVYLKLNAFLQIAYGEGPGMVYPFNFNDFCHKYNFPSAKTYNALQFLDRQGILTLSREFTQKLSLKFLVPSKEVVRYISLNPADEEAVLTILRNYTGVFDMEMSINTGLVTSKAKISEEQLLKMLKRMEGQGMITLRVSGNDSNIVFYEVREDEHTVNRVSKFLTQQNALKVSQLQSMQQYVTDTTHCKSLMILHYFDEETTTDCGTCSYCLAQKKVTLTPIEAAAAILELLAEKAVSSREIEQSLGLTPKETVVALQLLLDAGRIKINENNQYTLR